MSEKEKESSYLNEEREERLHRRKALSTMGRVAVGAAAAAIVGGVAYYTGTQTAPPAPAPSARTITQTVTAAQTTVTQTTTQAVTRAETITQTPRTVTQTVTSTPAAVAVKLATDRETMIIAVNISSLIDFDPNTIGETISHHLAMNMYDTLLLYKRPDLDATLPNVAESWTRSDDGLTWTFKIRDGIRFSNGDRLDAKDVEFSLRRLVALKKTAAFWSNIIYLKDPNKIKATDSRTVQVTMDERTAKGFTTGIFSTIGFGIVNRKIVEPKAKADDWGHGWLVDHTEGSGPYVLESWERDNQVVLKANENYWKEPPKIKKVIVKHVPEPVAQSLLLQKGDIDFAFGSGAAGLPVDIAEKLIGVEGVTIANRQSLVINYVAMNIGYPKDTPLNDNRARLAVRWSIDYEGLVKGILKGGGEILQTLIPPGLGKYHLPTKPFFKNIPKAKQLLAEAGYPNGFDIDLAVPAGVAPDVDIAALHQATMGEAGIRAKILAEPSGTLFEKMRRQSQQMVVAGWGGSFADPENYAGGHACYDVGQIAWRNMYKNDNQCRIAKAAGKEDNDEDRARLYKELQEEMLKDTTSAVTHVIKYFVGRRTWTEDWEMPLTWSFTQWNKVYKEKIVT